MSRFLTPLASVFFPLSLALLSFAAIPAGGMDSVQQQGILVAFAFGIACCLVALELFFRRDFFFRPAALLGAPLIIVAALSSIHTHALIQTVFGYGFEPGTVGSLVLFAAAIAFGTLVPRDTSRWFFITFIFCGVAGALGVLLLRLTADFPSPLIGSWPDTSFLLCSAALVAAVFSDGEESVRLRVLYGAAALALLAGFGIFFNPVAAGIGVTLVVLFVAIRSAVDWISGDVKPPFASILTGIVIAVFLMSGAWGAPAATVKKAYPSLLATQFIIGPAYTDSLHVALVGTGPGSFSYAWSMYKPLEINTTQLWAFDPVSSYSTVTTFAVTLGLLGVFALFFGPLVMVMQLMFATGKTFLSGMAGRERKTFEACIVLILFTWASMAWYPAGLPIFLIAGLVLGYSLQFFPTFKSYALPEAYRWMRYCMIGVLVGVGGVCLWVSAHQFAGAWYHTLALDAANATDARPLFEKAADAWPAVQYQIDASDADAAASFSSIPKGGFTGTEKGVGEFRATVNQSIAYSDLAVTTDPRDYESWLARASLYVSLEQLAFPNASTFAEEALIKAGALAPTNPRVPYVRALLAFGEGDRKNAAADVQLALALKPDYADALKLQQEINPGP